ncbi:Crp/Fnr family transcriptional regulator [Pontivivens ytuae]|uniref:Helix-turn-helix domain-containing protein n=1 Tax=Pontivivens ytuae TaxID=2789856 RepID=A0A7S9LRZ2_9RHOB|nr:helix-turn-helix domain-containing protein [Pontivivens ytuae]QPH54211.1 helix-turn-helix domain-containing protein [Pontivivens ytuae]
MAHPQIVTRQEPKQAVARASAMLEGLFDLRAVTVKAEPGETIAAEGEEVETIYRVISGTVRCCGYTGGGQRQIFRFCGPGSFLGAVDQDRWRATVEATDCVILSAVPRCRLDEAIARSPRLCRALFALMTDELRHREAHLVTLSHLPAHERLRVFLTRFVAERRAPGFVALPMTRQDIADHLGLTIETVSRSFGTLKRHGVIEMRGAGKVRIADQTSRVPA